jgi:hypothetical protein
MYWNKGETISKHWSNEFNISLEEEYKYFDIHEFVTVDEFIMEGEFFRSIGLSYCYMFR